MSERPRWAGGGDGLFSLGPDRVNAILLSAALVVDGSCDGTVVGGGDWQWCLEGTFLAIPGPGWVLVVASLIGAVVCVGRRRWWFAPTLPLGLCVYWGFWLALPAFLPGMCGEDPYCNAGGFLLGSIFLFVVVPFAVALVLVPIVGAVWPSGNTKRQPRVEPEPRPEVLAAAERIAALFETPDKDEMPKGGDA